MALLIFDVWLMRVLLRLLPLKGSDFLSFCSIDIAKMNQDRDKKSLAESDTVRGD